MLDPGLLRTDLETLRAGMTRRGVDVDLDALAELDRRRRRARAEAEELRARQKQISQTIRALEGDARVTAIAEASRLKEAHEERLAEAERLDAEFMAVWVTLPNLPDPTAAEGLDEQDAVELRRVGEPPCFDFEPKDHVEVGRALRIVDVERAAKVSGARFGFLLGDLVLLEFALVRWALDVLRPHGFYPVVPPVLVREHALFGTGFFPGDRDQVYAIEQDDLYLAGTSEVPLAAMHGDEIFAAEELPRRYAGFSTCFRREAGTYGKDTRGIFRVHQFDKVEMFSFTRPEASREEHDFLLAREEELIGALGLPYRVVNIAAGDLGASAAKKYDIEAWFPSQGRYREITSTSNTTDYQARRLRIRFRDEGGNRLVHTLNGTAVAIGRTLIAIVENFQDGDGGVVVPEVLRPYAGFDRIG